MGQLRRSQAGARGKKKRQNLGVPKEMGGGSSRLLRVTHLVARVLEYRVNKICY